VAARDDTDDGPAVRLPSATWLPSDPFAGLDGGER
jgi:hypothetical protein